MLLAVGWGCGAQAPASPGTQAATPGGAHQAHPHVRIRGHRFDDPERWARLWDRPERDAWQKPNEVLRLLALPPEARVADIGAGTGYFTVRFARALPQGRVYAVDVEPAMVAYLRDRIAREGLRNVHVVLGTPDDPRLPQPVDLAFFCNAYHHVPDRVAYLRRLQRYLRPSGRIAIVDYRMDWDGPGPPKHLRIPLQQTLRELQAVGYRVLRKDSRLLPRQYLVVAARPERPAPPPTIPLRAGESPQP